MDEHRGGGSSTVCVRGHGPGDGMGRVSLGNNAKLSSCLT